EDQQVPWLRRHRLRVEDAKMPHSFSVRPLQRHSKITFDAHFHQWSIFRKCLRHANRMVANIPFCNVLTWRAWQLVFDVRLDVILFPVRQSSDSAWRDEIRD